ncbi:DegT/DnrJ/EryC1/StrS family aminotransferase [bacterium]|nr:DegT/DnrJ/EryC1/StrS family aminotransferase [bacterium]
MKKETIPINDLAYQQKLLMPEILDAIEEVISSGRYVLGEKVEEIEKEIASLCGVKFGIGVNSGTDALILSLHALHIGRGDEVITSPFSFVASAESIVIVGARPVFADIDPLTFNISPAEIEKKISKRTKAIMPVHLFGQASDMTTITEIAKANSLYIIEDSAQAILARHKNKPVCSFGEVGCLSFYPTKNLGAIGDGGMILTSDEDLCRRLKLMRCHGGRDYTFQFLGTNSRLDELQAAILLVKLPYLKKWTEERRKNGQIYKELLKDVEEIQLPYEKPENYHVYHQFTLRAKNRDELRNYLLNEGIQTMVYYPHPLHLQPAFSYLGYKEGDFPEAEKAAREVISLPIYPGLKEEQIIRIANAIRRFYGRKEV